MFRDLFTNRFPFVAALIFFLLMVVGGTLYMKHVEQQEAEKLAHTQEQLKQWEARQQLTENSPVGRPFQDGHFHADGTWHGEPHDSPGEKEQMSAVEPQKVRRPFSEMPPEERLKAVEDWYRQSGLELPPEGYKYVWLDVGIPRRDENGNPILIKEGEPFFGVTTVVGFAPTREEFAQYQQMEKDRIAAALRGDDAEVERLYDARLRFWLEHQGEIPSVSVLDRPPCVDYTEQINERLYAEYRKSGI